MAAGKVEGGTRGIGNLRAEGGQAIAHLRNAIGHLGGHRRHGVRGPKRNAIIRKLRVPGRREFQLPAALHERFGTRNDLEGKREVLGASRQGSDHGNVGGRQHAGQ